MYSRRSRQPALEVRPANNYRLITQPVEAAGVTEVLEATEEITMAAAEEAAAMVEMEALVGNTPAGVEAAMAETAVPQILRAEAAEEGAFSLTAARGIRTKMDRAEELPAPGAEEHRETIAMAVPAATEPVSSSIRRWVAHSDL